MRQILADEDLILTLLIVDRSQFLGESVLCDHGPGRSRRLFDILRRSCSDVSDDQLLGNSSAE